MGGDGQPDTGGDGNTTPESGWDTDDFDGLWGWLSGIVGGLETVWQAITNLPQVIWDNFKQALTDIKDGILGIPQKILDGIKELFIPDNETISETVTEFTEYLQDAFGWDTTFFTALFATNTFETDKSPFDNVVVPSYEVHGVGYFVLQVVDYKFLIQGVNMLRPYIKGVVALFLMLYNIKMILSFIRQDAGVAVGKSADIGIELNRREKENKK